MTKLVEQSDVQCAGGALVLVGVPDSCAGTLHVHNPTDQPVKLKRIRMRSALQGADPSRASPGELAIPLSARLSAGETRQLAIALRLAAGTPPGTYEASFEDASGVTQPVAIRVQESRRARFLPASISVSTTPADTFVTHAHLVNEGNVATLVPRSCALELHVGERGWPHHFHVAARESGEQGAHAALDTFFRRLGADEPALGRVKVLTGAGPLEAQMGRLLELQITLPKQLRADRKYQGIVRFADATLTLALHVASPGTQTGELETYP